MILSHSHDQTRDGHHNSEVEIIHNRDDPLRPLCRRNDLRVFSIQSEQRESRLLLYKVRRRPKGYVRRVEGDSGGEPGTNGEMRSR